MQYKRMAVFEYGDFLDRQFCKRTQFRRRSGDSRYTRSNGNCYRENGQRNQAVQNSGMASVSNGHGHLNWNISSSWFERHSFGAKSIVERLFDGLRATNVTIHVTILPYPLLRHRE